MKWLRAFVLCSLISSQAQAESFRISGEMFEFQVQEGMLISGCPKSACEALRVIKSYSKIDLKTARRGQKTWGSIGSDTCRLIYRSRSMLGQAANHDQRSFCVFKDSSMVETNSLGEWLLRQKRIKE